MWESLKILVLNSDKIQYLSQDYTYIKLENILNQQWEKNLSVAVWRHKEGEVRGRGYKGACGYLESDGNVHRVDEGDYFVDVYIYLHLIKYILKFVQYIFILAMVTF